MSRAFIRANSDRLKLTSAVLSAFPITLSAWFYSDNTTNTQTLLSLSLDGDVQNANSCNIAANGASSQTIRAASCRDSVHVALASSATGYSANTWTHAGGVFASSTSTTAFINGVAGTTDTTNVGTTNNFTCSTIGYVSFSSNFNFTSGRIAECGIWAAALTTGEMSALAKGVSPLRVRPQSLAAYWPLFGNGSPEPNYGPSGSTYNMTVTGATQAAHSPTAPPFGFDAGWRGALRPGGPHPHYIRRGMEGGMIAMGGW